MKIGIIGDIHNGTSTASTTHQGIRRLESGMALTALKETVDLMNTLDLDVVIQMGDVIRDTFEKEVDKHNFHDVLGELSRLKCPLINVLGNHDVLALDRSELSALMLVNGMSDKFVGTEEMGGVQLTWLDLSINEMGESWVTNEGLELLRKLDAKKPALVFSHYSIPQFDPANNFYTNLNPAWMSFVNGLEVQGILSQKWLFACVAAHAHWGAMQVNSGIPYLINPAFSENIMAPKQEGLNPGAYSILELTESKRTFKSFSGEWAFLNLEF